MKEKILLEEFRHFDGAALRLALLDHHHGSELDFDQRGLRMAVESAQLFRQALRRNKGRGSRIDSKEFQQRFAAAMDADLNTPGALKILRTLAIEIMQDGSRDADQAQASLNHCLRVLGVELDPDSTR